MSLTSVSIRRPVFGSMLVAGLVVLGIVSLSRLEVDLNPDVDFPYVSVTTLLRGAPDGWEAQHTPPLSTLKAHRTGNRCPTTP